MDLGIQCGMCGHTNDFDLFCQTPLGLPLPKFNYQCPKCHHAFSLVRTALPTINQHGQILPPTLAVISGQGSL